LSLRYRYIVAVNVASGVHIITEVPAGYRLARSALHFGDVVSIDVTSRVYVRKQHTHWNRDITSATSTGDSDQVNGKRLSVAHVR
jgi:hypothetical protein